MGPKTFLALCIQAMLKPEEIVNERLEQYHVQPGPLIAMWTVSTIISIPLAFIAWAFTPKMGYLVFFLAICFFPAYSYGVYALAKRQGSKAMPKNVALGFAVFNFLPVLIAVVLGWISALLKSPALVALVLLPVSILGARGRVLSIQAGTGLDPQKARNIAVTVAVVLGVVVGVTLLITLNFFGEAMRKGGY